MIASDFERTHRALIGDLFREYDGENNDSARVREARRSS
jgi:hypothetical protein